MARYNPFSPNGLVHTSVFAGRVEESQAMERMLFSTKESNPQHFLIHGERGIGKSSLCYVHEMAACGRIVGWDEQRYSFLTITVILEPSDSYESIIRKLGGSLRRSLATHQKAATLAKDLWDFLKQWEIMGVKFRSEDKSHVPSELLDELVASYAAAAERIVGTLDGILVLIDEADKAPASAHLGALLKGFTERMARAPSNRVCLGVAGVSTVLETLRQSHESALRLFTSFQLKPLSFEESQQVVRRGLKQAAERSGRVVKITPEAEEYIASYSEGYPHFIQQFAYSAFEADSDDEITVDDVNAGAWGEHGAFEQLGTKYFEGLYFDRIGSDDYRQVLRFMAERLDGWVSKDEIREHSNLRPSILNNAIKALLDRHIILPQPGKRGMYRLPLKSFAAWIKAYTTFPDAEA